MIGSTAGASSNTAAPTADEGRCIALPRPALNARLILLPGVPGELQTELEATVAAVWRAEGLTLQWLDDSSVAKPDFWLRLVPRPIGRADRDDLALGAVPFLGDVPQPHLIVSYTAVIEWMRRERNRRMPGLFFGAERLDTLAVGGFAVMARRALAYAAAHEIGHYVLARKTHERRGLMRRDVALDAIADPEHADLSLSPASHRRLLARMAQGAACLSRPALPSEPRGQ